MPVCDLKASFFDWDGIKVWEKFDTKYLQMILWEVKVRDTEEYIFDGMVLKFKQILIQTTCLQMYLMGGTKYWLSIGSTLLN